VSSVAGIDKRQVERDAAEAIRSNRYEDALAKYWLLVDRSHVIEEELRGYLRSMAGCYEQLGRKRAASAAWLFLGDVSRAIQLAQGVPADLARCAVAQRDHAQAARQFEAAGWLGHAAIQLELARNDRGARVLWERLADDVRLRDDPYTQGLVRFNLGRACARLGDAEPARRQQVAAMHLLTAAADGFEQKGLRERAFDCYGVLLTIGREGSFENLAEGYLNCVRILREDGLKYYVLQYYEDFQELALERRELHACATLYREAAEFARRQGMTYARHYRNRAAETHVMAGERVLADGGPPEMVENCYVAAIDAYNELGLYSKVRAQYARLAELPLSDKRRARYKKLAERLAGMEDDPTPMPTFPEYLRTDTAYPEIWRLDVIEWEQAGDPAETMAEVVMDDKWPDFTRRRALLCRLAQLGAPDPVLRPQTLALLASHLGRVEIYAVLAPLEKMLEHEDARVRAAVMHSVRQLFFKRSFVAITRGLEDEDATVRRESLAAVQSLHFVHAFVPLSRIFRDAQDPDVRRAALSSIGKIPSLAAAELMIDVLRHGERAEKDIALDLLVRSDLAEVSALVRKAHAAETGQSRTDLERVLRARGAGA
jgi:HEAT repeat protein